MRIRKTKSKAHYMAALPIMKHYRLESPKYIPPNISTSNIFVIDAIQFGTMTHTRCVWQ